MEFLKLFAILLLLSTTLLHAMRADDINEEFDQKFNDIAASDMERKASLRGLSRYLAQQKIPANATCDEYPRVCRRNGSPGRDCCNKKCANTRTDSLNCGICGYKCKSPRICCKGKCVNPYLDNKNCGECNNKCKKGDYCDYGMCSYA